MKTVKKIFFWFCVYIIAAFLLCVLSGCKTTIPSERITNGTITDLNNAKTTVNTIKDNLSKECLESVKNGFETVIMQIDSLKGRVESISDACKSEKAVIEEKVINRNIIIGSLLAFIAFLVYTLFRRK